MPVHTRIRPFNTKDTYPEQKLDNDLWQAVVARGRTVFVRGQISQDLDTRESLHVGDATLQTRSGIEALKLARTHRPNLILMDIQLPEVSGLEVTKWLKEDDELRDIPVVAVTAFAMKGDEERIRQGGCEAYISKPISVMGFVETVRRFIGDA